MVLQFYLPLIRLIVTVLMFLLQLYPRTGVFLESNRLNTDLTLNTLKRHLTSLDSNIRVKVLVMDLKTLVGLMRPHQLLIGIHSRHQLELLMLFLLLRLSGFRNITVKAHLSLLVFPLLQLELLLQVVIQFFGTLLVLLLQRGILLRLQRIQFSTILVGQGFPRRLQKIGLVLELSVLLRLRRLDLPLTEESSSHLQVVLLPFLVTQPRSGAVSYTHLTLPTKA